MDLIGGQYRIRTDDRPGVKGVDPKRLYMTIPDYCGLCFFVRLHHLRARREFISDRIVAFIRYKVPTIPPFVCTSIVSN